ncbi:hypothetical protein [Micromonospora inyonensis]|uniref:hypothetical protein n=1 Tax=Micromonospora inyonensis TaxID=47866 RepID=UPI000B82BFA3|nr:hypothetical protein [Micromonospora inyonensis]
MTGTGADWPGRVLRRPPVPAADPPTLVQPAAGRHRAGDDAHRDPGGWWWPAGWRPATPVDAPTLRLDPAAVARTRGENR